MRKPKQLEFKKIKGWGGKRRGAGRPNLSGTVSHMARPKIEQKIPLHLTMRLKKDLRNLRVPTILRELKASLNKAKDAGLRVMHFSLQSNHLHIFAECENNSVLSRSLKSFGCSFGKAIRKYCGGTGSVFAGRYHVHVLKSPQEVKNALAYVLLNQSKHQRFIPYKDQYSSAVFFNQWRMLLGQKIGPILRDHSRKRQALPDFLSPPKSWLAREGWKRGPGGDKL